MRRFLSSCWTFFIFWSFLFSTITSSKPFFSLFFLEFAWTDVLWLEILSFSLANYISLLVIYFSNFSNSNLFNLLSSFCIFASSFWSLCSSFKRRPSSLLCFVSLFSLRSPLLLFISLFSFPFFFNLKLFLSLFSSIRLFSRSYFWVRSFSGVKSLNLEVCFNSSC